MIKRQPERAFQNTTQSQLAQNFILSQGQRFRTIQQYFCYSCLQIYQIQMNLIQQLMVTEQLLTKAAKNREEVRKNEGQEPKSDGNSTSSQSERQQTQKNNQISVRNIIISNKKAAPRKEEECSSEQFQPQSAGEENWTFYNTNTSKKIVRDYHKGVFDYIQENKKYVSQLLRFLEIEQKSFKQSLKKFKGKVNSHIQFNAMFDLLEVNYAKALRVITFRYSREYRLGDIFSTYKVNHLRHLKYRSKVLQIGKKSFESDSIKD